MMIDSTAQKWEETSPHLRLVHGRDTTSDLREPREVTKDVIVREIDAIVRKYGSTSTEAIDFPKQELCAQILKKEPESWSVGQFVSERLYSQISSLSNSWVRISKENLFSTPLITPLVGLLPSYKGNLLQHSITSYWDPGTRRYEQFLISGTLFPSQNFLGFDSDKHAELAADASSIASGHIKNTNTLKAIYKELQELSQYESGWDGHGGRAISKRACEHAESFVSMMGNKASFFEPYPDPDGSVGLEFHGTGTTSMYFNFSAEGELTYLVVLGKEVHRGHGVRITDSIPAAVRTFIDAIK